MLVTLVQRLRAAVQRRGWRLLRRRMEPIDASRLDDVLGMLERDARLKGEMLDELREAARVGEAARLHRSSQVDFAELLRSTTDALVPLARERDISLHARCAATSVIISADARDLTYVVSRLLACAIASSERGNTVDCQLTLGAEWVKIAVRVHANDVGAVGRVLESADGSPSERDGAAWEELGLGTVRKLVQLYGGTVHVETQGPGSSSIFMVSLPGNRATHGPGP